MLLEFSAARFCSCSSFVPLVSAACGEMGRSSPRTILCTVSHRYRDQQVTHRRAGHSIHPSNSHNTRLMEWWSLQQCTPTGCHRGYPSAFGFPQLNRRGSNEWNQGHFRHTHVACSADPTNKSPSLPQMPVCKRQRGTFDDVVSGDSTDLLAHRGLDSQSIWRPTFANAR